MLFSNNLFSNNFEIIFYLGVGVILLFFILLVYLRFRVDDKIDLGHHFWIIFMYIVLLVLAIFTWRYIFDFFFSEKLLNLLRIRPLEGV